MFINVGAYSDNKRIVTKAHLKRLVKESPELLRFDQTSSLQDNGLPRLISLSDLKPNTYLSVVGPDPYNSRKWYATVKSVNGKVTVS